MDAVLGIFFKGVGLEILWPRLMAMAAIGVVLLALGIRRFRRRLA
jgi:ABC-2 type transport system permease protein